MTLNQCRVINVTASFSYCAGDPLPLPLSLSGGLALPRTRHIYPALPPEGITLIHRVKRGWIGEEIEAINQLRHRGITTRIETNWRANQNTGNCEPAPIFFPIEIRSHQFISHSHNANCCEQKNQHICQSRNCFVAQSIIFLIPQGSIDR